MRLLIHDVVEIQDGSPGLIDLAVFICHHCTSAGVLLVNTVLVFG